MTGPKDSNPTNPKRPRYQRKSTVGDDAEIKADAIIDGGAGDENNAKTKMSASQSSIGETSTSAEAQTGAEQATDAAANGAGRKDADQQGDASPRARPPITNAHDEQGYSRILGMAKLPLSSVVALEMLFAGVLSLLLIEYSQLLGPLGLILVPVGIWFEWFDTFFHEFGHALVIVFSASEIVDFRLNWDGTGSVSYYINSPQWPIAWIGYAMPPLVGALLYWEANDRGLATQWTLIVLAGLVALVTFGLPNEEPGSTWTIAGLLIASLLLLALICATVLKRYFPIDWVQRVMAATMIIGGTRSVTYLFGFGEYSDAASLAELTAVPEAFWVLTWLIWTALCVLVIYILEVRDRRNRQSAQVN